MINEIVARLQIDEGFFPYATADSRGYLTLANGICVDVRCGVPIEQEIATAWLTLRATQAQSAAQGYPWWPSLNDARQNIVACLLYNLGKPRFDTFVAMQAALAAGNWEEAADQLQDSTWYTQVGVRGSLYVQILATGNWPIE